MNFKPTHLSLSRLINQAIITSSVLLASMSGSAQETPQRWFEEGRAAVERSLQWRGLAMAGRARNVILFVGDGMGVSTVTAARILEGQLRGESGEENELYFETFPNVALSKTYNVNAQVSDSAGTMTAMVTGIKTDAGVISVNQNVSRGDCSTQTDNQIRTFLERAEVRGLASGVVSTARLTHATPAANYAHSIERDFESDADAAELLNAGDCVDIARQLVDFSSAIAGSNGLEVALGGGRRNFLPREVSDPETGAEGARLDGMDLTQTWLESHSNSAYVWNQQQFEAIDPASTDHLLGLFDPSHMQYEQDRPIDAAGEPTLAEMTAKAIEILDRNEEGYYLGETLIIVTADHSHTFTIAGYPARGNPILGKVANGEKLTPTLAEDGMPYTTLGYINGPGHHYLPDATSADANYSEAVNLEGRSNLSDVDTEDPGFFSESLVPLGSETHGGEDVAIYAVGPGSDLIRGVMEQHVIFHVMMEASQLQDR